VLRVTLSGWENGRHCPGPLYRRLLAEALEMTEADLGFGSAGRPDRAPSLPAGPELLNYLEAVLTQHIQADRTIGSYYLINVVQEHLKVIELCLHDTRSPARDDFLSLANRFAELCGWLNQDQRRYADAERWTSKALDFAQALDDAHLMSYTLMRRSNIATETGRGHDALLLAQAAFRPQPLTPGLRAVALRQKAAALALLGDERGYRQAVDDGLEAANHRDAHPLTLYCTVPYMKMEAGAAAMNLGRPRLAVQLLADAWRDWPTGHNRDRALCLARLAEVHAEMGDPDQACHIGGQALQAVRLAPSERTAASLRALRGALMPYRARAEVVELRQLVAEALP
jgi:tetratricopeptide (TPR) repeat protein